MQNTVGKRRRGRPLKTPGEPLSEPRRFRLPERQEVAIEAIAERKGREFSDVVRELIDEALTARAQRDA